MKQPAGANPPASQGSNQPAAEKSGTPQPEQQNQAEDKQQQAPVANSPQQVCFKEVTLSHESGLPKILEFANLD